MATIDVNIAASKLPEVLDAYCLRYGYPETVNDPDNPGQTIPNPETKAQFVKRRHLVEDIRQTVKDYRRHLRTLNGGQSEEDDNAEVDAFDIS